MIQSPPALQYTGLQSLTDNPFTTVGRQWPCLAPTSVQDQVRQITQNFSQTIQSLGYLGFFGLDFLISQDKVYLLECNPRLTASFAFYTQIELKHQLTPLFLIHLSQFLELSSTLNTTEIQSLLDSSQIIGSEITLKNRDSQTIKKYHDFIPFVKDLDQIQIPQNIINLLHEKG